MIKLIAHNETEKGFDAEIHIEGENNLVIQELTSLFDRIYAAAPQLFELALVDSKYTEDHI